MKQKVKILMLLTYICLVWAMTEGVWNENIWNIFATYLKSIVFFFGWSCLMFGMEHIGQSFWYGIHGYGVAPVILFPFIVRCDKEKRMGIFLNVFKQMVNYYPSKLYEKYPKEEEKVESVCERAQIVGVVLQSAFSIFCGIVLVFFCKKSMVFLIVACFFTVSYFCIGRMESAAWQGAFVVRKYIRQGCLCVYLANQCILYTNENHEVYRIFERKVFAGYPEALQRKVMETIKHMYMIGCINDKFRYPSPKIAEVIEKDIMLANVESTILKEAKFDLLKTYLCYGYIKNDTGIINMANYGMERIKEVWEYENEKKFPNLNSAYYSFGNYREDYLKIIEQIKEDKYVKHHESIEKTVKK